MKIEFIPCPGIPRLAWGAVVSTGGNAVTVYHGTQVEIRDDGFVEGAWDGPYEDFPPFSATVVCGSGGALYEDGVRFWAGTDNIYPIYSIRKEGRLFVANSLVFAFVLSGEHPDPYYPFYFDDFIRIIRLGFNAQGRFRTASKHSLRVNCGHIMSVDGNLRTSFSRFPSCSRLPDYATYFSLLETSVTAVLSNARSRLRQYPLKPVAACSGGYDTNASAVFARRASCRNAITFFEHHEGVENRDSGVHIARALDLHCTERDRSEYLNREDLTEFCFPPHATGCPYAAFEEELGQAILVVGNGGDNIWRLDRALVYEDNRAPWARFKSGYGISEFRLRIGLVVFAVPHIGSIHNRDIHAISHSPEMAPWRIGGDYDRPIPRRILEEAGVPRGSFGMEKMASAQAHIYKPRVRSAVLGERYSRFIEQRHENSSKIREIYWRIRYKWRAMVISRLAPTEKQIIAYTWTRQRFSFLCNRIPLLKWSDAFTFQYRFDSLKGRYSTEFEGHTPEK